MVALTAFLVLAGPALGVQAVLAGREALEFVRALRLFALAAGLPVHVGLGHHRARGLAGCNTQSVGHPFQNASIHTRGSVLITCMKQQTVQPRVQRGWRGVPLLTALAWFHRQKAEPTLEHGLQDGARPSELLFFL